MRLALFTPERYVDSATKNWFKLCLKKRHHALTTVSACWHAGADNDRSVVDVFEDVHVSGVHHVRDLHNLWAEIHGETVVQQLIFSQSCLIIELQGLGP